MGADRGDAVAVVAAPDQAPAEHRRDGAVAHGLAANVWIGVSTEDQARADERAPLLAQVPGRVRFLSCEPLISAINLRRWLAAGVLHWVIVGGESGGRRRDMDLAWLASITAQCRAAGVPVYVKQDSGPKPGQQGRIPAAIWALKQFPAQPGRLAELEARWAPR